VEGKERKEKDRRGKEGRREGPAPKYFGVEAPLVESTASR